MTTPEEKKELERALSFGAFSYMLAYIKLKADELGIPQPDEDTLKQMALQMVRPFTISTEAVWHAMGNDVTGLNDACDRFQATLTALAASSSHPEI